MTRCRINDTLQDKNGRRPGIPRLLAEPRGPYIWRKSKKAKKRNENKHDVNGYYECDIISVGVIVTRAEDLNDAFKTIYAFDRTHNEWYPIMRKYGASTTWMGKLKSRLDSRRNGGCPVLAIGIRNTVIKDWDEHYIDEHSIK